MRLLNPEARRKHPPGIGRFYHYMTEHGVAPEEAGVKDEAGAWRLKTLCVMRSYCFWLNKGIDVLHYFSAHDDKVMGMGLLPPGLNHFPPDATFDQVATPPMKAIRNLSRAFAGSTPLTAVQPLQVEVSPLGKTGTVFEGKVSLTHPDVFAFLPFQVNPRRYVVAVYVSTYDATRPMPEERYRLLIRGFADLPGVASLYDPISDHSTRLDLEAGEGGSVQVVVSVTDYPRLLVLDQGGEQKSQRQMRDRFVAGAGGQARANAPRGKSRPDALR